MWRETRSGRSSVGSEVVMMDSPVSSLRVSDIPNVASLNVTNSPQFHLGPKIFNVNQTVHNSEVIKGNVLGLELVSAQSARRLRCSVAVFVCWAFVVASALAFLVFYFVLKKEQTRLDIDLPISSYLCTLIKSTTRTERISCFASVAVLVVFITLVTYYSLKQTKDPGIVDGAPHEWNITRKDWLAVDYNYTDFTYKYEPLKLVIVQHTVSADCYSFVNCAAELRNLQRYYIHDKGYDIPYNFLIGNDGRVYEGRGWSVEGAHTYKYNRCTIGLGFIGDYRQNAGTQHSKVTATQVNRTMMLLEESMRLGFLAPNFFIVGAKDLQNTESPGDNLYNEMQHWYHYDHEKRFYNKSCDEIEQIVSQLRR